jgi:hypothetical protein
MQRSVARIYARVKATMILRTTGDLPNTSGLRHRRFTLPAALAGAVALLLTIFAAGSGAGVSDYQGTLYFAGPASSVSGSWQITTAAPAGQGPAPVASAGAPNSGGVPTGAYKYVYVTTSGVARTASVASNQVSVTNAPVTVTNVPVGAEVYRARIPSSTNTSTYILLGTAATTPYVDTSTATSGTLLPQADNRVAVVPATTGWAPFVPGVSLMSSVSNTAVSGTVPSIPASCTGWIVDAAGGMTFPAGLWTIGAQARPDANGNGAAVLTAAVWKVNDSGTTVSGGTVVPPTDGGSFTLNGMSQTVSVSYTTSAPTTLADNEHLCVQFWRHQTTAYSSGGATSRTIQMLAWDPNNKVSVHPAPNASATASLSSPANGLHTTSIPTLGATYSDAEGDAGNLTIRLCSDSGCGTPLQNSGAMAATNGATLTWDPAGPLADGTYYWQAQAQDGGGASSWTASRSFTIDNAAPTTTIDSSPPAQSNAPSGTFAFSANEAVTGFQCRVNGGSFGACTSPHPYGPLADGPHTFDVKAVADLAGNAGPTTSYGWTVDTVPPNTTITSTPAALSNTRDPSFGLSSTQSGSTFECSLDGGAFASCTNPQTYSGLADGPHTFEARAIDPAGNPDASPDSYAWTIDATPPDTTIGPSQPAALTTATGATFDFAATELPATFQCSLDGGAFTSCTSPKTYSALADGSHTFQVRAVDTAANADPSPASYTWTIDTTPPVSSIGPAMPSPNTSSSTATFGLGANESGSTFECRLDGAAFSACTSPTTYLGLADGSHTFDVRATDSIGNVDTSPASYTWRIDNVAPATPASSSPADGLVTNAPPQLRVTFADATAGGDTGTVEYQLCSSAAPAGTACMPVVQIISSAIVSNGAAAPASPAALPDGTYYWQARARDAAGNYSPWSATQSFQLDTIAPDVPVLGPPDNGAWVSNVELGATFSKPSFAGVGKVEFRICSDALCLGIVTGGTSDSVNNGSVATWASFFMLRNGLYYWQARAIDAAGNTSPWSDSRILNVHRLAVRVKPKRVICAAGSILRLRVQLSARANVRNRLLNGRGRLVKRGAFGTLRAGTSKVRVKLPRGLRRGSYRLVLDATGMGGKARALVRVKVGARSCRAR